MMNTRTTATAAGMITPAMKIANESSRDSSVLRSSSKDSVTLSPPMHVPNIYWETGLTRIPTAEVRISAALRVICRGRYGGRYASRADYSVDWCGWACASDERMRGRNEPGAGIRDVPHDGAYPVRIRF
jgi:hypothetical protein